MTELFRFISLRPPRVPPARSTVAITPSPHLLTQLDAGPSKLSPSIDWRPAHVLYWCTEPASLRLRLSLPTVVNTELSHRRNRRFARWQMPASIQQIVKQIFREDPQALVGTDNFRNDRDSTMDALIVASARFGLAKFNIGGLNAALRAILIIQSVAAGHKVVITRPVVVLSGLRLNRRTNQSLTLTNPSAGQFSVADADGDPGTGPLQPLPTGPSGVVTPVGIGDLLVVKQRLKRYEGGDVAHIENVLRSETFNRDTRRLDRIQTTLTTESDMTTEERSGTASRQTASPSSGNPPTLSNRTAA